MKWKMVLKVKQKQSSSCRAKVAEEEEVSRVNQVLVKKIHFMDFFHHLFCQRYHTSSPSEARIQSPGQARQAEIPGHRMTGREGRM